MAFHERLQNSLEIGRSAVHTFAYPCDCEGEPRGRKRFHHVIHCAPIECGERVLIVSGDENHMTFAARHSVMKTILNTAPSIVDKRIAAASAAMRFSPC